MANVQFKRGTQQALNALTSYTEGTFYLTSDTDRLYVAQASNELVELNKSITIVDYVERTGSTPANATVLPVSGIDEGQFYYVNTANILCVYHNNAWVQINPEKDTQVKSISIVKDSGTTNAIKFNVTLKEKNIDGSDKAGSITTSFTINKQDINDLVDDVVIDTGLAIKDVTNNANKVEIATTVEDSDSIYFEAGTNVTIDKSAISNKTLKISATDTNTTYTNPTITSDNQGKLSIGLKASNSSSAVSTNSGANAVLYNTITIDKQSTPTKVLNQGDLGSFYSASKIDELLAQLDNKITNVDAMQYMGTIGTGGTAGTSLPSTSIRKGYTYKAVSKSPNGSSVVYNEGDLLIATGTEGTNGYLTSITWTVIPSGDDIDSTYTLKVEANTSKGQLTLRNTQNNTDVITVDITGDDILEVSSKTNSQSLPEIDIIHKNSEVTPANYGPSGDYENASKDDITEFLNLSMSNYDDLDDDEKSEFNDLKNKLSFKLEPGDLFSLPNFTVDSKGHITVASNKIFKLPTAQLIANGILTQQIDSTVQQRGTSSAPQNGIYLSNTLRGENRFVPAKSTDFVDELRGIIVGREYYPAKLYKRSKGSNNALTPCNYTINTQVTDGLHDFMILGNNEYYVKLDDVTDTSKVEITSSTLNINAQTDIASPVEGKFSIDITWGSF